MILVASGIDNEESAEINLKTSSTHVQNKRAIQIASN